MSGLRSLICLLRLKLAGFWGRGVWPGSPQRVARADQKSQKTSSFCTSATPIPAEGSSAHRTTKKKTSFCTSTTTIPAEGRAGTARIAKNLEFLYLDQIPSEGSSAHFCTSTTPIPAEGRAGRSEIAKNLELLHLDHADHRRSRSCPGALES